MKSIRLRRSLASCVCCGMLAAVLAVSCGMRAAAQSPLPLDKASRTPAERKVDSQLLIEIARREASPSQKPVTLPKTAVRIDAKERAYVDVRADATPALLKTIRSLGSDVLSFSTEYRSILAWVPLLKIKQLAGDAGVQAIMPAAQAITNQPSAPVNGGAVIDARVGGQSAPATQPWTLAFHLSGGFAGYARTLRVSSEGSVSAEDARRSASAAARATPEELAQIASFVTSGKQASSGRSGRCRDCLQYVVDVDASGQRSSVQLDDTTLADSGIEPIIKLLTALLNRTLSTVTEKN